jgi:hypothetical protein
VVGLVAGLTYGLLCAAPEADAQAPDSLAHRLAAVPLELLLADSNLRIVNVYRPEAVALLEANGHSRAEVLDRLARDVYRPYAAFWKGYLGDETQFREWAAASLFAADHPIHMRLAALLDLRLDSLFTASARWLVNSTGRRPRGIWYIVFGPGWTDMGGFRDGSMVADFTKVEPDPDAIEYKLPHELTHMVHGASPGQRSDPDSSTVLQHIVSEGLATYATYVYAAGRRPPRASGLRRPSGPGRAPTSVSSATPHGPTCARERAPTTTASPPAASASSTEGQPRWGTSWGSGSYRRMSPRGASRRGPT